jgi:hypothetical protein
LELLHLSVPQLFNTNNEYIEATCPIPIPMGIPPSYSYKNRYGRSGVHVNIYYDIKLEVKAKGLFSDFELQVPIIIGTHSAEHSSYASMTTPSATPIDLKALDMLEFEVDDDGIRSTS